jgi:hypothetical protein
MVLLDAMKIIYVKDVFPTQRLYCFDTEHMRSIHPK